jgi:hypothetical protein
MVVEEEIEYWEEKRWEMEDLQVRCGVCCM